MNFTKNYLKIVIAFLCLVQLTSCSTDAPAKNADNFTNQSNYDLKIGDTLRIYYSTNSCCYQCAPNKNKLKTLKFIGTETVIPSPEDVDGGSYTIAMKFEAVNAGVDTLLTKIIGGGDDCSDTLRGMNQYRIVVRN